VHVISFRTLRGFAIKHADSLAPLKSWHKIASKSTWFGLTDVRSVYPHADTVGRCTVFNVGGNGFRLVVQIEFKSQVIYIKKVMTHAEYSRNAGKSWKKSCGC